MNVFNPKITFKAITDDDIPFLYTVYRSTRIEEFAHANFTEQQLEDFLQMQFVLQHNQYMKNYRNASFDLIMIHDSTPVGRLYVNRMEDDIRIIDIAILPEYRNQGIGRSIMHDIIQASEKTSKTISLHVEQNNPALKFYQRLGFTAEGSQSIYLFMKRMPHNINK